MIAVLAARVGYQGNAHVTIAASDREFIHTATLLGMMMWWMNPICVAAKATANAAFGNAASVLVGDLIYTRAFQMMTSSAR